jgi:hypothetical protein
MLAENIKPEIQAARFISLETLVSLLQKPQDAHRFMAIHAL